MREKMSNIMKELCELPAFTLAHFLMSVLTLASIVLAAIVIPAGLALGHPFSEVKWALTLALSMAGSAAFLTIYYGVWLSLQRG